MKAMESVLQSRGGAEKASFTLLEPEPHQNVHYLNFEEVRTEKEV
jgi:hypothetical protein